MRESNVILELRTYRVARGRVEEFVALMNDEAVPLLAAAGIDVVRVCASLDPRDGDPRDACLIRAFASEDARAHAESEFYGSAAWREGPRDRVLALIESFHTVILAVSVEAVEALRAGP